MSYKQKFIKTVSIAAASVLLCAGVAHAKTFKVAVGDGGGSAQEALGLKFAELLEAKSGGKHKAKLFLNGQLGSEQDTVNDAALGTLDASILASNNLAPFSPTMGVLSLPYMIQTLDEAQQLTLGEFGEKLTANTVRDAGVRVLGWTYSGFRVLSNSEKPIRTLEDLKGMVVRVPKNDVMIKTYNAWGINPTPMAWSETFTALQQGVVDGQDTPYTTINAMKFYEVQKYITDIHYLFLVEPLVMSEQVFSGLNEKTQKMVLEAGREASDYSVKWLTEKEAIIRTELVEKHGMEIVKPANDEKDWIEAATTQVWPEAYKSVGGKEVVNEALGLLGRDPM